MVRNEKSDAHLHLPVNNGYNAENERKKNIIGNRISQARHSMGIRLPELSEKLKRYGVFVGKGGLSKWETGLTVPNAYQLMALCSALDIESDYHYFMESYQTPLNEIGMAKLNEYKMDLLASGRYRPVMPSVSDIRYIEMPVSLQPASAGTGYYVDDDCFEKVKFPEASVPPDADFGVRVSGDSMEPVYHDGQIVWVKRCDELNVGEVGLFVCDGQGFIKSYAEREPDSSEQENYLDSNGVMHPQPVLISFNQKYLPRVISPFEPFSIIGKILK